MAGLVGRWQRGLEAEGLAPGDRVAISARNSVAWVCLDQAALGLGLIVVPLYTTDNPDDLAHILADAGVRLLVLETLAQWPPVAAHRQALPDLSRVVCLESKKPTSDPAIRLLQDWVRSLSGSIEGLVAIDGKTLRRSHDRSSGRAAIHMVSAWASENRLVLGQVKTEEKSNEITAIPVLLRALDIHGCLVTIDAMGCQTSIAKQIVEQGGDYLLALKGNQSKLAEAVGLLFTEADDVGYRGYDVDYHETDERRAAVALLPDASERAPAQHRLRPGGARSGAARLTFGTTCSAHVDTSRQAH